MQAIACFAVIAENLMASDPPSYVDSNAALHYMKQVLVRSQSSMSTKNPEASFLFIQLTVGR